MTSAAGPVIAEPGHRMAVSVARYAPRVRSLHGVSEPHPRGKAAQVQQVKLVADPSRGVVFDGGLGRQRRFKLGLADGALDHETLGRWSGTSDVPGARKASVCVATAGVGSVV